jgi:hypothetical protein
MISCRLVRSRLLEMTRQTASDAIRLEVESHLQECASCQEEAARWKLIGLIKQSEGPRLTGLARRRILDRLVTVAAAPGGGLLPRVSVLQQARRRRGILVGVFSATALAAVMILLVGVPRSRLHTVGEGEVLDAVESGSISFGGARVAYQAGSLMTFHPATRGMTLSRGEVGLDVTPGLPGRFRVTTSRFIVEVLGTQFLVSLNGVRTLHGTVRVLDLAGSELAVLEAGHAWTFREPPSVASTVVEVPTPTLARNVAAADTSSNVRDVRVSTSELLARGRAALARGDAAQARSLGRRAVAAARAENDAAAAELLLAQALLVGRHPDEAIKAFRRVARTRSTSPEGELASFTIGQLLSERGWVSEAEAAFNEYLARYPAGRFVREAREHLSEARSGR